MRLSCWHLVVLMLLVTPPKQLVGQEKSPAATPGVAKNQQPNASHIQATAYKAGARALSRAFRDAARSASPAVVTVFSYGQNSDAPNAQSEAAPTPPAGEDSLGPTPPHQSEDGNHPLTGLGSGVIVDLFANETPTTTEATLNRWVMTNNHVVRDAKKVVVQLPNEVEIVGKVVHGDPDSDVAVIQLADQEGYPAAVLGDSDHLEIGDWVLAIGSPFKLEATVSAGIISAKDRTISKIRRGRLFQTDAAINPGNSGGPLVDLDGRVIALSTAIATRNGGYQGIGFAIPINQAKWIAKELASYGKVRRAAMGIRLAELNPRIAGKLKLPVNLGVLIYQVIKDSAADQAGLENLDVILEFAGQRVRKPEELQEIVERQPVGSEQVIKIFRQGDELVKTIVLAPVEDPTDVKSNQEPLADDDDSDDDDESVDEDTSDADAKDTP